MNINFKKIRMVFGKMAKHTKHLTVTMKRKYLPLIIKRDGENCSYCGKKLDHRTHIYEHLNNNRSYNELENIVLACHSCNNKKPYDSEMQKLALEKLKVNEMSNFMRERNLEDEINSHEASTEIEINVSNFEITEQYISDIVNCDGCVGYSDALNSCVALCKEKTGHGSQQSVRNYLAALTSTLGCFTVLEINLKMLIIILKFSIHCNIFLSTNDHHQTKNLNI